MRAELVRLRHEALKRALTAQTTRYFAFKGVVEDERIEENTSAQLAAAVQVAAEEGLVQSRSAGDQGKDTRPISITYAPTYNAPARVVEVIPS